MREVGARSVVTRAILLGSLVYGNLGMVKERSPCLFDDPMNSGMGFLINAVHHSVS